MRVLACICDELMTHYGRHMLCERCLHIQHLDDPDMGFDEVTYHVVLSQGRRVLAVYGLKLTGDAEAQAEKITAQTGFPAWLEMVVGARPEMGLELPPAEQWVPQGAPARVV